MPHKNRLTEKPLEVSSRLKVLMRLRPALRFVKYRIMHVDDSPERIARGLAVGVFVAYLPLMGVQMAIAWMVAAALKANKMMAVLGAWVSTPATAIIIYYPSYRLGRWLLGVAAQKPEIDPEQMEDIFEQTLSLYRLLTEFHTAGFWKEVSALLVSIGLELFVGGILIGFVAARVVQWLAFHGVIHYRRRKQQKWYKKKPRNQTEAL